MNLFKRALTLVTALGIGAALLTAGASVASANPAAPEAKKAEIAVTAPVFFKAAVPTVWTAGRIFKDHNAGGGVLQTFTANDGACDTSGYGFNLYLSSANSQGSSVQMHALAGSRCNRVEVVGKSYNGVVKVYRFCNKGQVWNFPADVNDKAAKVKLYNSNLCSPV